MEALFITPLLGRRRQKVLRKCAQFKDNGRVHTDKKFCARTLDLDLLTYDSKVTTTPVVLPREEICYNAFVLWPLAELVPNDIHPETQETYAKMWQNFDKQKQQLWPIDFTWS